MPHLLTRATVWRDLRALVLLVAGLLGFGAALLAGIALAKSFKLKTADATVTSVATGMSKQEKIVVNSRGFAVYTLSGDSKKHPKCIKSNGCFGFWPPLKVSSKNGLSKQPGIKGKLGVWKRDGFMQVTLGGHPLYRYVGDGQKDDAMGEAIKSFGGTWHVIAVSQSQAPAQTGGNPQPTGSTPTSTPTNPYPNYP